MPDLPPHSGLCADSWALFLDVDGTLLEIAAHPDAVIVPEGLGLLLRRLTTIFNGAVAIISGRSLASIDALLGDIDLDVAGCHGAELRVKGALLTQAGGDTMIPRIAERLARLSEGIPLSMVEIKPHSIALHYRPPALDAHRARALAQSGLGDEAARFRLLDGKNVVEILPAAADKGHAIARFLDAPPYRGRIPVFIGDDVTDEEGFREVNARGGFSIRVGINGETAATHRANDVAEVMAWLEELAESNAPLKNKRNG